ncbi:Protein ABHD13 [Armadillidium nasatum]|uniref:Protein ABHD13 n=1 Tax=Armadillidium nasatum TaxID=96803 RepID=A0A5N5T0Q3_9CRUS|nr:Protein ABHD13 [Armadillidium nasatum]
MRKYWITSLIVITMIFLSFFMYGFIVSLLLFLCGFFAIFYQISDQLVYWPNYPTDSRCIVRLPSSIGLPSENLFLYARDGTKLHAVFVKQESHAIENAPTFVYMHGNAGNIGHRLGNIYDLYRILGINILVVEYRGYGLSQGSASEQGLYLDAEAAICYLRTRTDIDLSKIVVFGRSLGGAVAIDCVSRSEIRSRVAALVIENTFTSIPDMAKVLFAGMKILPSLPEWCHKNKFNSKLKMCRVVVPSLLLSGQADTLVPPRMMMELYQSCPSPMKRMLKFVRGSHNETWRCRGYYQGISEFLDEVFFKSPRPKKPLPPGVTCVSDAVIIYCTDVMRIENIRGSVIKGRIRFTFGK